MTDYRMSQSLLSEIYCEADDRTDANINTQMNYWAAELTNLPEVTESLWNYMEVMCAYTGVCSELNTCYRKRGCLGEKRRPSLCIIVLWDG